MRTRMTNEGTLLFWCPGCQSYHGCATDPNHRNPITGALWRWNGDRNNPTISPSILIEGRGRTPRCHSFVEDGRIRFLSDCSHALAGQTLELEDEA